MVGLLILLYVAVFIIGWLILADLIEDGVGGCLISLLGIVSMGALGSGAIFEHFCVPNSMSEEMLKECQKAIPIGYFFIPVVVLFGLAAVTSLFAYREAISRCCIAAVHSVLKFFRPYQERFLKYREEKKMVSNAEAILRKSRVPPSTLGAIRKALDDLKECLEKIPKFEKLLIVLRKHRSDVKENIKTAEEEAKKTDLDAANGGYFSALMEDEKTELCATDAAISDTEREIAEHKKRLEGARRFLAVVPQEKEYYETAAQLDEKILKEQEQLKKELTS